MIAYSDAVEVVRQTASRYRLGSERIPLLDAHRRISAESVIAREDNPRFATSAMDGYALLSKETRGCSSDSPVSLRIVGTIGAGDNWRPSASTSGTCVEILTGAPVPEDIFDAVVRLEEVDKSTRADSICLTNEVERGSNIRCTGEDFSVGEVLVSRGTLLGPHHVMALAAIGATDVEVFQSPKIVVICSGNELVSEDCLELEDGKIRNSSGAMLRAALQDYGAVVDYFGIVRDSEEDLRSILQRVRKHQPDILITTGGVSVGSFDYVKNVLVEESSKVHFHNVAMRPGKPLLFGELRGTPTTYFGLPGNPISTAVGLRFFVKPYLRALRGEPGEAGHKLPLATGCKKPAGLAYLQRGVKCKGGVRPLQKQGSFVISSFLEAQGWIVTQTSEDALNAGELIEWFDLW